jgi:glutamine kinase
MDVFILGAGKPARGIRPAALKRISSEKKALDWQLHSFNVLQNPKFHFLGGYHIEEVIESYPDLNYTMVPGWEQGTILQTFFQAPFSSLPAIVTYADTIFRQEVVSSIMARQADVVFGIDSEWQRRFESRTAADLATAEIVDLKRLGGDGGEAEFTGLIFFKQNVVEYFRSLEKGGVIGTLINLLYHLHDKEFSVEAFEVGKNWVEFNSPSDISRFALGTKAETLACLKPIITKSFIGKQTAFTKLEWSTSRDTILDGIKHEFQGSKLIIRSSAKNEDSWNSSNAGAFDSFLNINGLSNNVVSNAIDSVISSYEDSFFAHEDQILVQKFIANVKYAGVVFTCGLETGSPYYRFNFDDKSSSTVSVTGGKHGDLRTIILHRQHIDCLEALEPVLVPVLTAVREIEELLCFDKLDIEFAVDSEGLVHIFQVRPITVDHSQYEVNDQLISECLSEILSNFNDSQKALPFIQGSKTIFGNMPDWNPAEIIGIRPKPLAFSLYRYLITNDVWDRQRAEFGYRDVRPSPLLFSLCGQPYVDIRASLNSFIPASLSNQLTEKLVNAYQSILENNPHCHDRIEFDVAFTIWTPTFERDAVNRLSKYGLNNDEITLLGSALKVITHNALERLDDDIASIQSLFERRKQVEASDLNAQDKFLVLLGDCRRYGTLAFAHAARAGFVATALLKSFVSANIIPKEREQAFMQSLDTVARKFQGDRSAEKRGQMSLEDLVGRYGHLRPGTYDIGAKAYWEKPDQYLVCNKEITIAESDHFLFSSEESEKIGSVLLEMEAGLSPDQLTCYLKKAIESRESVKFEFTKNVSRALDCAVKIGESIGINREQAAYLEVTDIKQLKLGIINAATIKKRVAHRLELHTVTHLIELPTLIFEERDFYCFERQASQPNFVTTKRVVAKIVTLKDLESCSLNDMLVLIPQADPGYDWLLGHGIGGLITKYGGANSHMAIRAAEIGLPAAIGVGEKLYELISQMGTVELDCGNRILRELL